MTRRPRRFPSLLLPLLTSGLALHVAAQSPPQSPGMAELQVFDVRDLLDIDDETRRPDDDTPAAESIARFLRRFVDPALHDGGDVRGLRGGHLVVRGAQTRIQLVADALAAVRAHPDTLISAQLEFVYVSAETHARVVAPRAPKEVDPRAEQFSITIAPGDEVVDWTRAIGPDAAGVDVLMAPRILTRPLQRATMSAGERVRYRKDVDEATGSDGRTRHRVVHDELFHGLETEVTSTLLGEGLAAVASFSSSEVERPIPTFTTRIESTGERFTIDLPVARVIEASQTVIVPDGGVSVSSVPLQDGRFLLFCIRLEREQSVATPETR